MYQMQKVNIKRTTTRKFLCANDSSGVINVFTMLQELASARGLLLIGSFGETPLLEDKEGFRFRAICKGKGKQRWIELKASKVAKALSIDLIPSSLSLSEGSPLRNTIATKPNQPASLAELNMLIG